MLGFLLMFGTAFEYIRRNHFEVFYYCHIIGLATAMIGACWHETGCFAFFIPAIGLWLIDRIVRAYKSWVAKTTSVRISEAVRYSAIQEGIARIVFEYKGLKSFKPGQYVFMSFVRTNKKPWQYANWHPFTISEIFRAKTGQEDAIEERIVSPESTIHEKGEKNKEQENASAGSSVTDSDTASYVSSLRRRRGMQVNDSPLATVHIKGLGKNTQALLKEAANNEKVTVRVDGPYGPHLDYQDYEVVAAFGAGIGITPAMAFIKDCVERRADGIKTVATSQIYLVWAVRAPGKIYVYIFYHFTFNLLYFFPDEIVPFMDMVTYWQDRCESAILPIKLNVSVYVTRVQEGPDYFENLKQCSVQYGTRPDIATTMENIKLDSVGREVWVHVCGSDLFTRSVMNEATRWNFDAHHETFEF
jgi:hypothetical protein